MQLCYKETILVFAELQSCLHILTNMASHPSWSGDTDHNTISRHNKACLIGTMLIPNANKFRGKTESTGTSLQSVTAY